MSKRLIISLLLGSCTALHAQEGRDARRQDYPPPSAPFFKQLAPQTSWKIAFSRSEHKATDAPKSDAPLLEKADVPVLKELLGARTDTLRHETLVWEKFTTERWFVKSLQLVTLHGRTDIVPTLYPATQVEERLGGFPELKWLALAHYKGVVEIKKQPCYFYEEITIAKAAIEPGDQKLIASGKMPPPEDHTYIRRAWIAINTGLPIAFENETRRMEYTFQLNSPVRLALPPRFQEAARKVSLTILD